MTSTTYIVYEEYLYDDNVELKDEDFYLLSIINDYKKNNSLCVNDKCYSFDDKINRSLFFQNNFANIEIKTETENVTFDLLSGREIELRVTVITDVYVYSKTDCSLISNAETVERPKDYFNCLSSVVIYTVQKGDSLWTIAKKYNTTVNDILSANSIEHKDEIVPGQKIRIPCAAQDSDSSGLVGHQGLEPWTDRL